VQRNFATAFRRLAFSSQLSVRYVGRTKEDMPLDNQMSNVAALARTRKFVLIVSIVGAVVFSGAFITSFARPVLVERLMRQLLQKELEQRSSAAIAALDGSALSGIARRVVGLNAAQIQDAKRKLSERLPERIAAVVAEMSDSKCECRKVVAAGVKGVLEARILTLATTNERLTGFVREKYRQIAAALLLEFRIFTASNAVVFILLGSTLLVRRGAALQLLLPVAVLLIAAGTVAFFYLFKQDWLHTIFFGNYVGFGYLAYLAVAIGFLADVILNRARMSTNLFNFAANAAGSAITAIPC
jgi:hypothetical protein